MSISAGRQLPRGSRSFVWWRPSVSSVIASSRGLGDALGFYAAGVVAFLSLAATMSLREAWLTVALSIQLPLLARIHQRIAVRSIRTLAAIVAGVVLVRLVLNYNVFWTIRSESVRC